VLGVLRYKKQEALKLNDNSLSPTVYMLMWIVGVNETRDHLIIIRIFKLDRVKNSI
jgi:hypothetical protein